MPLAYANMYFGGSYGMSSFTTDKFEELKVSGKGSSYGGFIGFRLKFVGVETFYQKLNSLSDIKHEGEEYQINNNSTAVGAAVRFNFQNFFLRAGYASHTITQNVFQDGDEIKDNAINQIYDVDSTGSRKDAGFMYGGGLHYSFTSFKIFADYTKYHLNEMSGNYQTFAAGVVINFAGFDLPKMDSEGAN
jgi:hypothetical protein